MDLEISLLRTFLVVADLKNFTAAGELLGATQSTVSLRIARLESLAGTSLLARTSRAVSLTEAGQRFIQMARECVAAHDAALSSLREPGRTMIRFALSDHAVGAYLGPVLSALKISEPNLTPDVMVGLSAEMRDHYDRGEADVAIVRQDDNRHKAISLFDDPLVWVKSARSEWTPGDEVPLVALRGPCGVKAATVKALDLGRIPWRFAFMGGSVLALQAAVDAGLGLGVFGRRHAIGSLVGSDEGLPVLQSSLVVMHTRLTGQTARLIQSAFANLGRKL